MEETAEVEIKTTKDVNEPEKDIPFSLSEFGEIPADYVTVFIQISKERLELVGSEGFKTSNNQMSERNPELERLFNRARVKVKVSEKFDRTKCIFAYPHNPRHSWNNLGFSEVDVLIEAKIDPTALVVNAEFYTEASNVLDRFGDKEWAMDWAKSYWEEAQSLSEFLKDKRRHKEIEYSFFEVLIPEDIPTERLKVVD